MGLMKSTPVIDFSTAPTTQAIHGLAGALKQEVERELRAALQPVFDKIVQDALATVTRHLHASLTEQHDHACMNHTTLLRVDGVEKMRLP